jgi:hypothetical protein
MKKVVRIVILSVFAFCLSIACKNYTEDIEDYLSYWSAGVSIAEYRFEPQPQIYTEGMQYVSSKAPVTVTFTVHNSKNLHLKMPGDSDAPADIISFPHIPDAPDKRVAAPQSGNDYEFKKISNTELKLTYNPAFLQKYEWGRGDITPSIILYTTDGRVFKQNIPFKLNVNTPPPALAECVIGQTETAPPSETCYYVLCLQLSDDDMKKTCGNGLLHGDIAGVEINGTIYNLSVDRKLKQLKAQADSPFIDKDKVKKLDTIDAKEIPSDWTLYFKTEVEVKPDSPKTEYTVKLKDAKGLYSEPVTVGTQGKIVTVTFKLAGGNISGSAADITRTGAPGASFTAPANPTKDGYTFNRWDPMLSASPTFPAANATYTAQWQEISKPGMRIKEGISAEEKSYEESGSDDLVSDAGQYKHTTPLIIYKESGQAKLSITGSSGTTAYYRIDTETGTAGTEISLSADGNAHKLTVWAKKGTDDSIKTVLYVQVKDALTTYKELKNVVTYADDNAVINIGNNLNCTEESSEIEINKTLTVQRKVTSSAPSRYIINANEKGRFFKVVSGGQLTLKELTLKNGKMSGSITTGIGGGIQVLSGGTCQLTNCIITECKAVNGGALIVEGRCTLTDSVVENNSFLAGGSAAAANVMAAGTLVLERNTVIKDNKTADGNPDAMAVVIMGGITLKDSAQVEAGNNIHLSVETAYITVDGNLAASPTAAGVSMPSFSAGRKVLAGNLTPDNIGKFTLTGLHADQWKINASGNLEAVGGQSPAIAATSWEDLRTKVQNASDGTVIEVTKNLTYDISDAAGKESIITVNKNITIKSKDSNTYILNAGGKGADNTASNTKSIGIFEVSGGKTLTLEKLILTKTEKYAIYVAEGDNSLTMKNVTIKDCKTKDNAAGIYFNKGKTLTLENCTIEKCNGNGGLSSGGIEIQAPTEPVSIKDTTIENCKAIGSDTTGGGIHLWNGQCTLENVTVDNCSAKKGGGMCVKKSTLTITGGSFTKNEASGSIANGGGGAIYSEDSTVTITGCTIGGDNPSDGNSAGQGGGIFVSEDARCTLNAGTKISGNKAIRIEGHNSSGGGIFVDKAKSGTQAGTLTINRSSGNPVIISKNTADYGGGVYNYGTATINHAEIKDNNVQYHGGGMFNAGTCTMDGVTLQNNKAKSEGGGIYSNKELTLKNTTVTGNEATTSGGAIQIATGSSVFNMSGSTVITVDPSKNDIYLTNDAFITLTGELTATKKIARITLNSSGGNGYKADRVVVKGGSGFNITADYKNKFTITDKIGNPQHWKLIYQSNALKLKKN